MFLTMLRYQVNRVFFKQTSLGKQIRKYTLSCDDDTLKVLYPLESRKLLKVSGNDAVDFLQGLITNDMAHFENANSMYAMFLNHKGRVLYDTLIHKWSDENTFMLECDKNVLNLLQKHLTVYRLKRQVDIKDISPLYNVWALIVPEPEVEYGICDNGDICGNVNIYQDPRITELGYRLITTTQVDKFDLQAAIGKDTVFAKDEKGYKYLRYRLGVSEGAEDLFPGVSLPLEANCDYLHGVSFHKGCYIGQELTARVHHTGVVRKRIMPIRFKNIQEVDNLEKDAPILITPKAKTNLGKLKSYLKNYGLGLVRIKEALEAKLLHVGDYPVEVIKPSWWPVEAPKERLTPSKFDTSKISEAKEREAPKLETNVHVTPSPFFY